MPSIDPLTVLLAAGAIAALGVAFGVFAMMRLVRTRGATARALEQRYLELEQALSVDSGDEDTRRALSTATGA